MANWWEQAPVVGAPQQAPQAANWWEQAPAAQPEAPMTPENWTPPAPPPGVVIHDAGGVDRMSDQPDVAAIRPDDPRAQAIEQEGLRRRYQAGALSKVVPFFQGDSMGWGDEAVSKMLAAAEALRGGDPQAEYEIGQAAQKQMLDAERQSHPWASTAGQIAGGILPALTAAPASMLASGYGAGTRILAGGADGLLQGAVAGAGSADDGHRLEGATEGAKWGAGLGLGGSAVMTGAGKGVQAIINAVASRGDPTLAGVGTAAKNWATKLFSDPDRAAQLQQRMAELGPDAMLADVSPEWNMVARGAAARPGSRDPVVEALMERQSGANQRLGYDLDAALGRRVVPSQVEEGLAANRNAAAEDYGPVMGSAVRVETQPLADALDAAAVDLRGPAQRAVQQVRGYLNIPGTNQLDPNPQALMATRQAIDGLLANEQNPQVIRQLTMARQQVDGALAYAAPGVKTVDANIQELFRQSDALQQGRPILNNGDTALRPEEVANMVQDGAQPAGALVGPSAVPLRLQQGVRAELDRITGTKANDATALRLAVRGEGDWNRQKLATIFGEDNADAALAAIDRESTFGDTANRVTRGSDTAPTAGFEKAVEKVGTPTPIPTNMTWLGLATAAGKKGLDTLRQGAAAKNAEAFAQDLGRTAVAQGPARDQIIEALMQRAMERNAPLDPKIQLILDALGGTRQGEVQQLAERRGAAR
jgi:hypothetical protein